MKKKFYRGKEMPVEPEAQHARDAHARRLSIDPKRVQFRHLNDIPEAINQQNKLAMAMIDWALTDSALDLEAFPLSLFINPYKFFQIATKNDYFAESLAITKELLGVRLRKDYRDRKIDYRYLEMELPSLCRRLKDHITERHNIAAGNTVGQTVIKIIDSILENSQPNAN